MQRFSWIVFLLVLFGCSQVEVSDPDDYPISNPGARASDGRRAPAVTRARYIEQYKRFREQHKEVFKQINGNKLALRNSGKRAVEAVDRMLSLVGEGDQSELQKVAKRYREAWENFDTRTPSKGERMNLRNAGNAVEEKFKISQVRLLGRSEDAPLTQKDKTSNESSNKQGDKTRAVVSKERSLDVQNPALYRKLIKRWQKHHQRFKRGLEATDPLFESTYEDLSRVLDRLVSQVKGEERLRMRYFKKQYQFIYQRRDDFFGTRKMADHLSVLKKQFLRHFGPSLLASKEEE